MLSSPNPSAVQSTDKELLDFGHDSEDELDSDEEEGEEQEEEREAAGAGQAHQECHRLGRLHAATHSLLSHAASPTVPSPHGVAEDATAHPRLLTPARAPHRFAGAGAPAATQQRSGVTLAMVEGWCAAARDKASMGAVRNIIKVGQGAGRHTFRVAPALLQLASLACLQFCNC